MNKQRKVWNIIFDTFRISKGLTIIMILIIVGAIVSSLLPPLILEKIINDLSDSKSVSLYYAFAYIGLIAIAGILQSAREVLLTVFGQKITKSLRKELCNKLERLSADTLISQEPGAVVSRFVGDVDTVETLFSSGIISMISNVFQVISIFSIILVKNTGLGVLLLILIPFIFIYTRNVQIKMLKSQVDNRIAISKVSNHVPETIKNIRTIHLLKKEEYMRDKYDSYIEESYEAMEKTNFYDAIYSPVILIINAAVVAVVLILSASGIPVIQGFFGMSVGTAVAVINYISQVFGPLEEIGMEIQTIQSAIAGVHRIDEFLLQKERWSLDDDRKNADDNTVIVFKNVSFEYEENCKVLNNFSFELKKGEYLTLAGRTGAGKSTIFKLILGLYQPSCGEILINGQAADKIPDSSKRKLFGYVEQNFRIVSGSIADQISLLDADISRENVIEAAKLVGLHDIIMTFENGYDAVCKKDIFSQGQWQLLSIARAVAAKPEILLLDEITANLDADTEKKVLIALHNASANRTVISISHRLYEQEGGRIIEIE